MFVLLDDPAPEAALEDPVLADPALEVEPLLESLVPLEDLVEVLLSAAGFALDASEPELSPFEELSLLPPDFLPA